MLRLISISYLVYYAFGTLYMPLGDFNALLDIPVMYKHCKLTEDKDMTAVDFVTDHLIDMDALFDQHDKGDEQKPHTPIPCSHPPQQAVCIIYTVKEAIDKPVDIHKQTLVYVNLHYVYSYVTNVFHPPLV